MHASNHSVEASLAWATNELKEVGIITARLDSLILLEDILSRVRAHLLAHPELELSQSQSSRLHKLIERRRCRIPLAYLRNKVMFYDRTFYVNHNTLVPRPESEDMISLLKKTFNNDQAVTIADVGTGSGCLGITAALELKNCVIDLYDISALALAVAKKNALQYGIKAQYFQEDLLSKASSRNYNAILANLPYVPQNYDINQDATFEPKQALFAGKDGLDEYRTFWHQLSKFSFPPPCVLTESMPDLQHKEVGLLALGAGYELADTLGFIQLYKAISS